MFTTFHSGAYVPLTKEGNIMVDGVLASCYPSTNHDLAHFAMTPDQLLPKVTEWILEDDTGFQVYSHIGEQLGKWIMSYGHLLEY